MCTWSRFSSALFNQPIPIKGAPDFVMTRAARLMNGLIPANPDIDVRWFILVSLVLESTVVSMLRQISSLSEARTCGFSASRSRYNN